MVEQKPVEFRPPPLPPSGQAGAVGLATPSAALAAALEAESLARPTGACLLVCATASALGQVRPRGAGRGCEGRGAG
jgi:hypothetical protein